MKKIFLIILFIWISYNVYSNPLDNLNECISWIGKNENLLIEQGAINHINDVDLRQYGMYLLRYFVWTKGNVGYFAQTTDGVITRVHSINFVSGVNSEGLIVGKYNNKSEFDSDAEFARKLVYSNDGRLDSTRDILGDRTIIYEFFTRGLKVNIIVFMNLKNQNERGYGEIKIEVSR
jgi:hypothetical protein